MSFPGRTDRRAAAVLLALLLLGCAGLSAEEEERLVIHQQNSKVFYDGGELTKAVQQCRLGLALEPDDKTLRLTLAFSLLRLATPQDLAEAESILADLNRGAGREDYRVTLGHGIAQQTLARLRQPVDPELSAELLDRARENLERTVELRPDSIEGLYHLALLDLEQERLEDFDRHSAGAVDSVRRSLRVKDLALERMKDERQRQKVAADRAVDFQRGRTLLRLRAELAYRQEDVEKALENLNSIAELGELARGDYFDRARILERLGRLDAAVADYEHFIDLSRSSSDRDVETAVQSLYELRAKLAEERLAKEVGPS